MINILNKLKLQNKNANCCDKQCVLGQKSKTQQQQHKLSNIKAIAGEFDPGTLVPKAVALPLYHRVN